MKDYYESFRVLFMAKSQLGESWTGSCIFLVNIGFIWILLPAFGLLSTISLNFGLWIPYFSLFAGVSHIALAIKARKLYNPGLIVSFLFNIPVGTVVIYYFFKTGDIANPVMNIHFPIGLGLNLICNSELDFIKKYVL